LICDIGLVAEYFMSHVRLLEARNIRVALHQVPVVADSILQISKFELLNLCTWKIIT